MHKKYFFFMLSMLLLLFLAFNKKGVISTDSSSREVRAFQVASRSTTISSSATLHAVLVADTDDRGIGSDVDLKNIEEQLKIIKKSTGLILNQRTVAGNEFNYDNVTNTLNNLLVTPDDVVIFYYSGHGANRIQQSKRSRWPSMKIGSRFLDLNWVTSALKEKKPRLFIAMSDSCNNFFDSIPIKNRSLGRTKIGNYRPLFLHYRGYIIASAAKPGQVAGGSSQQGGLFTNAFLNSFNKELASSSNPSWHTIMKRAESPISFTDDTGEKQQQNPQFDINIERVEQSSIQSIPTRQLSLQVLPTRRFQVGETMQVKVTNVSRQTGYVFVWDISSDGQLTRILPNAIANEHRLAAGQTITIPESISAGFSLTLTEPTGRGLIVALLVETHFRQKVLSEHLEAISAADAQTTLQQLREQLKQIIGRTDGSIATVEYEIVY